MIYTVVKGKVKCLYCTINSVGHIFIWKCNNGNFLMSLTSTYIFCTWLWQVEFLLSFNSNFHNIDSLLGYNYQQFSRWTLTIANNKIRSILVLINFFRDWDHDLPMNTMNSFNNSVNNTKSLTRLDWTEDEAGWYSPPRLNAGKSERNIFII